MFLYDSIIIGNFTVCCRETTAFRNLSLAKINTFFFNLFWGKNNHCPVIYICFRNQTIVDFFFMIQ